MTDELMMFDPATRAPHPYPSHAAQWSEWHGRTAWLYNPWTGEPRHPADVGSDVFGALIVPPARCLAAGAPLRPKMQNIIAPHNA